MSTSGASSLQSCSAEPPPPVPAAHKRPARSPQKATPGMCFPGLGGGLSHTVDGFQRESNGVRVWFGIQMKGRFRARWRQLCPPPACATPEEGASGETPSPRRLLRRRRSGRRQQSGNWRRRWLRHPNRRGSSWRCGAGASVGSASATLLLTNRRPRSTASIAGSRSATTRSL